MPIQFNCCIIINCIRDTNDQLYHHLVYHELVELLQNHSMQTVTKEVETVDLFLKCLDEIHNRIKSNNINPWIHIFSHGNEFGFQFNHSNETMTWSQMADSFFKINNAMNYKLFLNLTCCKGINIEKMLETNIESFHEVVGSSTDLEIRHAQIINKGFYEKFLQGNRIEDIVNEERIIWERYGINSIRYIHS